MGLGLGHKPVLDSDNGVYVSDYHRLVQRMTINQAFYGVLTISLVMMILLGDRR